MFVFRTIRRISQSNYITGAIKGERTLETKICGRFFSDKSSTQSNADEDEVNKFSQLSSEWWDENGEFRTLHTMNALRIPLIRDGLYKGQTIVMSQPLQGMKILDVGCGGGLLTEPLSRLGAKVTGIDASDRNIKMADWHASLDPQVRNNVSYRCCLVEELADEQPESFDGVVASEILEHVPHPNPFVDACCHLVKPGGSVFFTTLNKTQASYWLAIVAAEQVLRIVTKGAHDWEKFVPIEDLKNMLLKNDFSIHVLNGMTLNPITLKWSWFPDTSINYAIHAVKKDILETESTSSK